MSNANTVELNVSREGMIHSMGDSFTNRETFILEILQNARRAGASNIDVKNDDNACSISFRDNGSGINDPQTLLMFGDSDWTSKRVMETESPFGVGFAAAIFASTHIRVESNGWVIDARTWTLLAMEPIAVEKGAVNEGTQITVWLDEYNYRDLSIERDLPRVVTGFPIPVSLNGTEMPRSHAIDSADHEFMDLDIGAMSRPNTVFEVVDPEVDVYLQGFRIGQIRAGSGGSMVPFNGYRPTCMGRAMVIHLDSSKFRARMPDRAQLVDHQKSLGRVCDSVSDKMVEIVHELEHELTAEEFIRTYTKAALRWAKELLNDKPIPVGALDYFYELPCYEDMGDHKNVYSPQNGKEFIYPDESFTFALSIDPESWFVESDDLNDSEDGYKTNVLLAYLTKMSLPMISERFNECESRHWIYDKAIDTRAMAMSGAIRVDDISNPKKQVFFPGKEVITSITFCDSYTVVCDDPRLPNLEIDDFPFFDQDERRVVMPFKTDKVNMGAMLKQFSNYMDEFEDYDEDGFWSDCDDLMRLSRLVESTDMASFLQEMISDSARGYHDLLNGQSFRIEFGPDREIKVEKDD